MRSYRLNEAACSAIEISKVSFFPSSGHLDAFGTSLHCRSEIGDRAQVLEYHVDARNGKQPISLNTPIYGG